MSRRFQFSLRALFVAMLAVACFFGGIRFERERQRRADEASELAAAIERGDFSLSGPRPVTGASLERIRRELFLEE